jgi:hypothetical protein
VWQSLLNVGSESDAIKGETAQEHCSLESRWLLCGFSQAGEKNLGVSASGLTAISRFD